MDTPRRCNVLMLYPASSSPNSFWSFCQSFQCDWGIRRPAAPRGLITVAAMLPVSWTTRLIDCNTETVTTEDIAWADVVFTGGMLSQQADALRLIDFCRSHEKPVVVGGPDATSSPPYLQCSRLPGARRSGRGNRRPSLHHGSAALGPGCSLRPNSRLT